MLGTGAVLDFDDAVAPQLLQTELGYTAMLAGLAFVTRCIFTLLLMPVVGNLIGFVQPNI